LEISAIREDITGQGPGQRVKKKSTTHTFPRRSALERVFPSCVVNRKSGTVPITELSSDDLRSEPRKRRFAPAIRRPATKNARTHAIKGSLLGEDPLLFDDFFVTRLPMSSENQMR